MMLILGSLVVVAFRAHRVDLKAQDGAMNILLLSSEIHSVRVMEYPQSWPFQPFGRGFLYFVLAIRTSCASVLN